MVSTKQPARTDRAAQYRGPDAPPAVDAQPLDATGFETETTAATPGAVSQPSAQPSRATHCAGHSLLRLTFNGGQSTKTVAGLGDPGRAGLWMETPLVKSRQNARVIAPNGRSIVLTLEPITGDTGAGSRLSIGAMRSLGAAADGIGRSARRSCVIWAGSLAAKKGPRLAPVYSEFQVFRRFFAGKAFHACTGPLKKGPGAVWGVFGQIAQPPGDGISG